MQPHQEEASAFGAALVAAEGRGLIADARAVARNPGYDAPVLPDAGNAKALHAAYVRYRELVDR